MIYQPILYCNLFIKKLDGDLSASNFVEICKINLKDSLIQFCFSKLELGKSYGFYTVAYNLNGSGASSDIITSFACRKPTDFERALLTSTTKNQIAISWKYLAFFCTYAVYRFEIYRNNGDVKFQAYE